jgi:O-antigen ligase
MTNALNLFLTVRPSLVAMALALFIVSPLINVGPVNIASFLLLTTSVLYCAKNPSCIWSFWRTQKQLLVLIGLLLIAFSASNFLNHVTSPFAAVFAQGRWLILLIVSAPAVARGIDFASGRMLFRVVVLVLLVFIYLYVYDAIVFLGFDSGGLLHVVGAERGDQNRPSWVFNPHPFSRTLIAALLVLVGVITVTAQARQRVAYILGILGLSVMLVLGAVRTAFIALVAVGLMSLAVYGGRRAALVLIGGVLLAALGLEFRERLFQESLEDESLSIRLVLIQDGIQALLEKPWFGGGYQAARDILWSTELDKFLQLQTLGTTNTHVQWLEMCVSYGVVGGAIFIALWLYSGWWVFTTHRQVAAGFKVFSALLFLNWVSLTVAGFSTVYRETEWALWTVTLLGTAWLHAQQVESRR